MAATSERERRAEDRMLAAQEQAANEERSRRAREQLEALRQAGIQAARAAAGLCIYCGQPLRAIARKMRARRHWRCRSFSE